jgi:ribonucleoside-diphosphate reductase alpha chain
MSELSTGKQMLSQSKFYMGYSRWDDVQSRYETWEESIQRVIQMHRTKYQDILTPELDQLIDFAASKYIPQSVLGAQRALQFGGEQIFKHESRMYNCSVSHCNRPRFFQEAMYLLLSGSGVGFSVQNHHINQLPPIKQRYAKKSKVFVVPDTIEGWADSFGVLLSSYFEGGGEFPEYEGCHVSFDFSKIRPKGSYISGGFKAPGPEGLRDALNKCEDLLDAAVKHDREPIQLKSITAYDFTMHMSDAVLSGGVRRSATICLFSKDDQEMMSAKTGSWYVDNPQRGRSNNSVVLLRNDTTYEEWLDIKESVKECGEPGFIWTDNLEFCYNPCVEIGMLPTCIETGESGFQFCNLTEINGGHCTSREIFLELCKAAAILGTLQAGYSNFKYLSDATRRITEHEALIGVSITGWMNNPDILFDEQNMIDGAEEVKYWNKVVADMININQASRTTCVKPSGNASVLLGTASGIHGEHSHMYFRNVQMNEQDDVLGLIRKHNPKMVEKSVWSNTGTDYVVAFPVVSKEGSMYKDDLQGVQQLEYVKKAQQFWVEHGTNVELCVDKDLRHNVSNTITVDDWDEVFDYIYENRSWFAGISLMSAFGDKAFPQAPFTQVFSAEDIMKEYGEASMFASGLIVDAMKAFNNNLWTACSTVLGQGEKLDPEASEDLLKRDWIRRADKFARNYFMPNQGRDLNVDNLSDAVEYADAVRKMTDCLKDCYNFHKWKTIERTIDSIDFTSQLDVKSFVSVDEMGAQACSGNQCEVSF